MKKVRVAGIIPIEDGFAFMHRTEVRKREDFQEYYTFAGGGLEEGETLEQGTIREIKEEFGINVKVIKKLYEMESEKLNQKEYFFLCQYVDGKFGTGDGPEFNNDPKYKDSGEYLPEIIKEDKDSQLSCFKILIPQAYLQAFDSVSSSENISFNLP